MDVLVVTDLACSDCKLCAASFSRMCSWNMASSKPSDFSMPVPNPTSLYKLHSQACALTSRSWRKSSRGVALQTSYRKESCWRPCHRGHEAPSEFVRHWISPSSRDQKPYVWIAYAQFDIESWGRILWVWGMQGLTLPGLIALCLSNIVPQLHANVHQDSTVSSMFATLLLEVDISESNKLYSHMEAFTCCRIAQLCTIWPWPDRMLDLLPWKTRRQQE